MKRLLRALVLLAVLGSAAFGSYYVVHSLTDDDGEVEAGRPSPTETNAALEADRAKPRIERESINGIEVGTEAEADSGYCDPEIAPPEYVDPDEAVGTELEISPGYLPAGAKEGTAEAVECGGVLVSVFNTYSLPDLRTVDIGRSRVAANAERSWALYGAAERISPVAVDGKTGVLEKPVVSGFDATTVVLNEEFGLTLVRADLPVDETIKIAQSLR